MDEKRSLKRRHLIYYLKVLDRDSEELIGNLIDITPDGMLLISSNPIEPDTLFKLKMMLPNKILGKEELIFDAKSIRCEKDVNPNFYKTGFQLIKAPEDHFVIIEELIDDTGFHD